MSKRYKLFLGDCLEVMKKIPDNFVDLVLTDPPYLHVKGGCKCKWLNKGVKDPKSKIVSEMSDFGETEINTFLDIIKLKMKIFNTFVFCSKLQIPYYLNWALHNNIQFDVLIWDKCTTGIHSYKFYSTKYEYIIRLYKKGLYKIEDTSLYQKVQRFKSVQHKLHEAEKPVELLKNILKVSSKENDIVLDPFMGSGTTGVACMNLNRKFIGIEKDEKYFEIAKKRIGELE